MHSHNCGRVSHSPHPPERPNATLPATCSSPPLSAPLRPSPLVSTHLYRSLPSLGPSLRTVSELESGGGGRGGSKRGGRAPGGTRGRDRVVR